MTEAAVRMVGVHKRFGTVAANAGVDLAVRAGEIHALLGENGAGKSTLMRILSGFCQPDQGGIFIHGRPTRIRGPRHALDLGIGMVHQHFRLVERFTVAENLLLGLPGGGSIARLSQELRSIGERFGLPVNPDARIWELSVGERQRVEIVKVLHRGAEVLLLDEPTAVLTPPETSHLFDVMRRMAAAGKAIIFISHKLNEVVEICDRITVLRGGKTVAEVQRDGATPVSLAALMVGRAMPEPVPKAPLRLGPILLDLQDVHAVGGMGRPALQGISLRLRSGEILGVAGVAGNGQPELAEVAAGMRIPLQGSVKVRGQSIVGLEPAAVHRLGLAFVPEDRTGTGLCPELGIAENLLLRNHAQPPYARFGLLSPSAMLSWAKEQVQEFSIRTPDLTGPVRRLSGGNAQKVVLARELSGDPAVVIAAQPTRGLDVAAAETVHRALFAVRNRGGAVLLISEDLDEVLALSDRVLVMYRGKAAGLLDAADADRQKVGLLMAGGSQGGGQP